MTPRVETPAHDGRGLSAGTMTGHAARPHADGRRGQGGIQLIGRLVLLAIPVFALAFAVQSMMIAFRDMYVFPFWDMISVQVTFFDFPWQDFVFFRDNEHLPFVAMPFFAADNLLFSARGTFLIGVLLVLNGWMASLSIAELKRCWGHADLAFAAAAGMVVALFFWLIHYENFIWPKQIHMYLSTAFALAAGQRAATLESRLRQNGALSAGAVAGLGLLLVLSTFSFGYGAIGWIAVLILAVTGRWPHRALATLVALFAASVVAYAVRYNYAVGHPSPLRTLGDPLGFLLYVGYYLGNPVTVLLGSVLGHDGSRLTGLAVTVVGVAVMARFVLRTLFVRRAEAQRADLFIAYLSLFIIGTGFMTAFSRLPFGVQQGMTSRYAVAQILFWVAIGLIGARASCRRGRLRAAVVAVGGMAFMALLVPSQMAYMTLIDGLLRTHWQSVLALATGVRDDEEVLAHIHPYPEMIESTRRNLKERRWSVYADAPLHWPGQPATVFRAEPASRCLGAVDVVSDLGRLHGQSRLSGWAWDAQAARRADWVVIVDRAGVVKGLARGGDERPDVRLALPQVTAGDTGWLGYADVPMPLAGAQAYAVLADGASICPIGGPISSPGGAQ